MSKKIKTRTKPRIDIAIQEIRACGECPWCGGQPFNNTCEHIKQKDRKLPFKNCWNGIPKWCPLDEVKDVKKITIKRRGKKKRAIWPENQSS
jgi:hypothetical protein